MSELLQEKYSVNSFSHTDHKYHHMQKRHGIYPNASILYVFSVRKNKIQYTTEQEWHHVYCVSGRPFHLKFSAYVLICNHKESELSKTPKKKKEEKTLRKNDPAPHQVVLKKFTKILLLKMTINNN